jgi:serine/threonine protein kinase
MELVEGDDLSQRIARGAMPLDEALPIAKQIADALEAAQVLGEADIPVLTSACHGVFPPCSGPRNPEPDGCLRVGRS